jgi:glycosyltransferase involved in cell wall biosynthesis
MSTNERACRMRNERPISILFIIDHLLAMGGGEGALVKAIRLLPPDRFRCFAMTLRGKIAPEIAAVLSCRTFEVDLHCSYGLDAMKAAHLIYKLIRSEHIDIIHTFFETSNIWGGVVAKLSGAPLLVSSRRDMGILRSRKHKIGYRLVNRLCDGVVAVSEQVRRNCIETEHIDPTKVAIVYNGVDVDLKNGDPASALNPLEIPRPDQVVITVANIRHVKGIDVVIRAAALVQRRFPHVSFLLVGAENEPDTVAQLHEQVRMSGLEHNVRFLGYRPDTLQLLRSGTIFCLLSRSEGFSNTTLEAMASGLPCVVTRVGGNSEAVIDGSTGFLVESEDYKAAADRICDLLRYPNKAAKMGRAGKERVVHNFSSKRMIRELASFYEGLVSNVGISAATARTPRDASESQTAAP